MTLIEAKAQLAQVIREAVEYLEGAEIAGRTINRLGDEVSQFAAEVLDKKWWEALS